MVFKQMCENILSSVACLEVPQHHQILCGRCNSIAVVTSYSSTFEILDRSQSEQQKNISNKMFFSFKCYVGKMLISE